MRLVMLTELFPPSVGGQEVRFLELAQELAKQNHAVDILCIGHDASLPAFEQLGPSITISRQPFVNLYRPGAGRFPRSPIGMVRYALTCRQWLKGRHFDAILLNQWPLLHVLTLRGKDRKRAVIDWCEIRNGQPYRLFQALLPKLVAANVAVSAAVQRHVAALSGGPVLLLPSGINRQAYYSAAAAQRSGLLYLGRLSPHKGVPLLIESFAALRKTGFTERLAIAGAGPAMAEVAAAKAACAFGDEIDLLGEVSEAHKRALLARHRVLVLPSQREGFPRVVAEAMASGLPVVTAHYPQNGTVGVVQDSGCGEVAEPAADALAAAIAAVCSDWSRYSQAASQAAAGLDWSLLANSFTGFVDENVIGRRRAQSGLVPAAQPLAI